MARKYFPWFMPGLVIFLLLIPSALILSEEEKSVEGSALQERVKELARELETVRGVRFKKSVSVEFKSKEEILATIKASIERDYPPERMDGLRKGLVELGFLAEETDLRKALVDFYSAQVVGFYDIEKATFFIDSALLTDEQISENPTLEEADRILKENLGIGLLDFSIFHELDHALLDQNFHLKTFLETTGTNSDQELACLAVVEGEATLANLIFVFKRAGMADEVMKRDLQAGDTLNQWSMKFEELAGQYPPYLVSTILFPYLQGLDFIKEIYRRSGWKGMDKLYSLPPRSTEQILHPGKYMNNKDNPVEVTLRDWTLTLGKDWKEAIQDTLGEFRVYLLINQMLDKEDTALIASEGWGGDRYALYENEKKERVLYLKTIWDGAEDAKEFFDAYLRSIESVSYKDKITFIKDRAVDIKDKGTVVKDKAEGIKRKGTDLEEKAVNTSGQGTDVKDAGSPEGKHEKTLVKGETDIFIRINDLSVEILKGSSKNIQKVKKEILLPAK